MKYWFMLVPVLDADEHPCLKSGVGVDISSCRLWRRIKNGIFKCSWRDRNAFLKHKSTTQHRNEKDEHHGHT
jgi:hypothetical protein